ncbi:hypothetical protein ACU60T_25235 [Klebsiella aerogenes]
MSHTLMKQLSELKLTGMATDLSAQMEQPGTYEDPSFKERLVLLVSRESLERGLGSRYRLPACQKPGAFTYRTTEPVRMGALGLEPADQRAQWLR